MSKTTIPHDIYWLEEKITDLDNTKEELETILDKIDELEDIYNHDMNELVKTKDDLTSVIISQAKEIAEESINN